MEQGLPPSQHFELEKLTDGVFATIARDGGAAGGNAGIIDLGDQTLVFDSLLTPRAATDLRVAAEFITGRQVSYIINSHWHNAHIRGNQVFTPETEIIASRATLQLIRTEGPVELQKDIETAPQEIKRLDAEIARTPDSQAAAELVYWSGYHRAIIDSFSKVKLRPPTWTFEGRLTFHGTRRSAELLSLGPGHSQDDTLLVLPDDHIAFASDLLYVRAHPCIDQGDIPGWIAALDHIERLGVERIVPGHGPLGSIDDVRLMRKYLRDLQAQATQIVESGDPTAVERKKTPAAYKDWRAERCYRENLRTLVRRLQALTAG